PVIQKACSRALEAGFGLEAGFSLAERIVRYAKVPVFIMTYANPVVTMGVEAFVARAAAAGAAGLIVPDLVPGADEGLYAAGRRASMPIVPVVVPTMEAGRLAEIASLKEEFIYAALRTGITGRQTRIEPGTLAFLADCGRTGMKVVAGFGIRGPEQIEALSHHVHAAVVGSALVEGIAQTAGFAADDIYSTVYDITRRLCGE
ncbi:MAG: tryptophan synthase subunit alpha, partial [Elusimicrobiales bacterium]|nr:tryptophan synthase subunit alpha [Elusimicrobiales bacterium]